MIELEEIAGGVVLPVKALAGARAAEVRGEQDGRLKVAVTQVAEKGKANQAIAAQLAKALGLRKSQVSLLQGATQPRKRFLIQGITCAELARRIDQLTGP